MPRQLYLQTMHNVVSLLVSNLLSITSVKLKPKGNGVFTIQTLASKPYQPLIQRLRSSSDVQCVHIGRTSLEISGIEMGFPRDTFLSKHQELECSFNISRTCSKVGISISHSRYKYLSANYYLVQVLIIYVGCKKSTVITFAPQTETFEIYRPSFSRSDLSLLIGSSRKTALYTLFTMIDRSGEEWTETLDIRAQRDNIVLEAFVNSRTELIL